jgi:hypothetical protein
MPARRIHALKAHRVARATMSDWLNSPSASQRFSTAVMGPQMLVPKACELCANNYITAR